MKIQFGKMPLQDVKRNETYVYDPTGEKIVVKGPLTPYFQPQRTMAEAQAAASQSDLGDRFTACLERGNWDIIRADGKRSTPSNALLMDAWADGRVGLTPFQQ